MVCMSGSISSIVSTNFLSSPPAALIPLVLCLLVWGSSWWHGQLVVGEAVELLPGQILDSLASQPLHGVVLDLRQLAWRQCAGQPPRGEEVGAGPGVGGAVQGGQHGGQV